MLPARSRMHRSGDFRAAVRGGVRSGRPTVVVHAGHCDEWVGKQAERGELSTGAVDNLVSPDSPVTDGSVARSSDPGLEPRVGFVVSKAVGNAVTRNRVKRRLRHMCRGLVDELEDGTVVVVRALPDAATCPERVRGDLDGAWHRALRKLESHQESRS